MGALFGIAGPYSDTEINRMHAIVQSRSNQPLRIARFTSGFAAVLPSPDTSHRSAFTQSGDAVRIIDGYLSLPAANSPPFPSIDSSAGLFAGADMTSDGRSVTLFRDPSGARPLYFTRTKKRLAFASDPTALLVLDDVPRELDPAAVSLYISMICPPDPITIYQTIEAVRPGWTVTLEFDTLHHRRFWSPPWSPSPTNADETILSARLREAMDNAVRDAMPDDLDHTGFFLSGGTDTGSVVALAARHAPGRIHTFTIGYEGSGSGYDRYNEFEYARLIAERFETHHHECLISPMTVKQALPRIIAGLHQPSGDAINTYLVASTLPDPIHTVLTGTGGDEIFIGSHWFLQQARLIAACAKWHRIPAWIRHVFLSGSRCLPGRAKHRLHRLDALSEGVPAHYRHFKFLFGPHDRAQLFTSEFLAMLPETPTPETIVALYDSDPPRDDALNRMESLLFQHEVSNLQLRDVDSMSHAHGIEARSPLVDRRILDVLCNAPGSLKAPNGQLRHLMFQAMGDLLMEKTRTRRKMSFIVPMDLWARRELRPIIDHVLSPNEIKRRGIFNPQTIAAEKDAFFSTGKERHPFKIWNLTLFELWCRFHIDAPIGATAPERLEDLLP
ncbi:hypothetical protein JXA80_02480 [bacterium]|nr:hypothetical protein [candidate division CSSED10-310 bacterium]